MLYQPCIYGHDIKFFKLLFLQNIKLNSVTYSKAVERISFVHIQQLQYKIYTTMDLIKAPDTDGDTVVINASALF